MKKISIVLFSIILFGLGASAQKAGVFRGSVYARPHVVYARPFYGYRPYYNYGFGLGLGYGFNYGYPNYRSGYYYNHPSKLEMQIQNIENDYSDRIYSVRADDSLSGHQRRVKIRALKHERNDAVNDARKNYYKQFEN